MSGSKDRVVVVGGGPNGLTCAALLAKAGRAVTLCEARDELGGVAAGRRFGAEGAYEAPGLLHDTSGVREAIVDALGLARRGLRRRKDPLRVHAPSETAAPLLLAGDAVSGDVSERDRERYLAHRAFLHRVGPVLARLLDRAPPDPDGSVWSLLGTGLRVRRLGTGDLNELLRVAPMCVADWMRDLFASERLSAAVALPAVEGTFGGPWSAGSALALLLREAVAGQEIEGGPAALVRALAASAEAHGVTVRTGAVVKRILVDASGARGVELESGERIEASTVVSSCDPRQTFLGLVGSPWLSARFAEDIRHYRARGVAAKVHLALSGALELADGTVVEALRTGESLDQIERAFDPVKYGRAAERPVLDVRVGGAAPEGHAVVSILAHYAPHDLAEGWSDGTRARFGDAVVAELARHCPRLGEQTVAREVLTPDVLARELRLSGGHLWHGEHALDQLLFMRPSVESARYRTPIPGLWLCGGGAHPGGGVTCSPGALAANAIQRA